jgi:hypothetical protein
MHTFTTTEDDKGRVYFQVGYLTTAIYPTDAVPTQWIALRECKTVGAALMWVNYLNGGTLPEKGVTAAADVLTNRWEHGT